MEMLGKLGKPQLRTVRAFRSGQNILWTHEEDVAWLVTYVAAELATGGVGPIDDADGEMEEECQQNNQGAYVVGEGYPVKPIKWRAACKVRWAFNGACEAVISHGPSRELQCHAESAT